MFGRENGSKAAYPKKTNTSSEIFASFTMSKIDKDVLESMTPEQVNAVYSALLAAEDQKQHAIDWRWSFSVYLARYYMVFFAGRDRRRQTLLKEAVRNSRGNGKLSIALIAAGFISLLLILAVVIFFTAYWFKSELGIDIFPDKHLEDFINRWLFSIESVVNLFE
jgi:hypothetical protein